uniref:Uncharacterized protein n=1 Tax=Manihot esculenta TaxID=3983 RepID=A0A2C9W0N9_MANES
MVTRKTPYDALLRSLHLNPCPRNPILFVKSKLLIPRRALDLETVLDSQAKPPINSITCSRYRLNLIWATFRKLNFLIYVVCR